jgi:hypothetical protein
MYRVWPLCTCAVVAKRVASLSGVIIRRRREQSLSTCSAVQYVCTWVVMAHSIHSDHGSLNVGVRSRHCHSQALHNVEGYSILAQRYELMDAGDVCKNSTPSVGPLLRCRRSRPIMAAHEGDLPFVLLHYLIMMTMSLRCSQVIMHDR